MLKATGAEFSSFSGAKCFFAIDRILLKPTLSGVLSATESEALCTILRSYLSRSAISGRDHARAASPRSPVESPRTVALGTAPTVVAKRYSCLNKVLILIVFSYGCRHASLKSMAPRTLFSLLLLTVTAATAATSGFQLGVDYSEWLVPHVTQIAVEGSGAIYILSSFPISADTPPSSVTKLSSDGKTILWQNQLAFAVTAMAVDPNGGVYVTPISLTDGSITIAVAKLGADGSGVSWTSPALPLEFGSVPALVGDLNGRAYLAVFLPSGQGQVVRLNPAGSAFDYTTPIAGLPTSIAVDGSGNAFIAGLGPGGGTFLTRLAPDGSAGFYSSVSQPDTPAVALDPNGDAVVYGGGVLYRFDSAGAITFSKTIASWPLSDPGLALDADGNAYVTGSPLGKLYPVRNSLATCGSDLLSVFARDGSLQQTTYIPGGMHVGGTGTLVAVGPNSTIFVVDSAAATFAPTRTGPFPASSGNGADFLLQLSLTASGGKFRFACLGNAATYGIGPIAPGGIFTLFGNGLGPEQGIPTQATPRSPFPVQVANVDVTFDGMPAPLLWVQDTQINLVAPWSLTPGQTTQVCASYKGVKANCLTWPVEQTSPGIFAVDDSHASALNQDGTLNSASNPAAPGSIVSVFATGLGPIVPPQADGSLVGFPLPKNMLPVAVESPGAVVPFPGPAIPLEVTYAGPAPYLVAGASQINIRILPNTHDIYVKLASSQSQTVSIYVASQ